MSQTEVVIAKSIDQWLRAEVVESACGPNNIWDNQIHVRGAYGRPHAENPDALKAEGHHNRFNLLMEQYPDPEFYNNDFFTGKVIHHALMLVSGNFRTQCYMQASGQQGYEALRFERNGEYNGAAGVDILPAVREGIDTFKDFGAENLTDMVVRSLAMNHSIHDTHGQIHRWHAMHPQRAMDSLTTFEEPVIAALKCQELGIQLAAGHISLAAQLRRGDLTRVPILEAKSISRVSKQPVYPFQPKAA
jgi:hypothetical protein